MIERKVKDVDAQARLGREIRTALEQSQIIDVTTTGRRTGQPRRVEIFLHSDDGRLFITGMPRPDRTRDWIHNIRANPRIVLHLKQSIVADVAAVARVVIDPDERRPLIESAARRWGRTDIEDMVRHSPLIVVTPDVPRADQGQAP